jgi:hypothetical protein
MLANLSLRSRLPALVFAMTLAMTAVAATEETKFAKECSLRDVKAITVIEAHGEMGSVPAEELADAFLTVLDAREMCSEGRVAEALAMYDSIGDLGPIPLVRVRLQ